MMGELKKNIEKFLDDCRYMRGLSEKTLKAYTILVLFFILFLFQSHICCNSTAFQCGSHFRA